MLRILVACAAALALTACSTTSVMHSGYRVAETQKFTYQVTNSSEMSVAGLAALRTHMDQKLGALGLAASPSDPEAMQIDVRISNYYMRHGAARALVGVMAGRDNIRSTVTVKRADGQQMGLFEVESYNATAWGTSSGLVEKHAGEIVDRVASLKSAGAAAPDRASAASGAEATAAGMKYRPKGF